MAETTTPSRESLKTYAEWAQAGRVVRAGQRANWYLVNEEGAGVAVFTEDQTEEVRQPSLAGYNQIVEREVWKAPKPKPAAKIHIKRWGPGVAVWCGSNATAIKALKKYGYRFDRQDNRWVHSHKTVEHVAQGFRDTGFEVVVDDA